MIKKYQRKINERLRLVNEGFAKDIAPYNRFSVKQFKRLGDKEYYEALWVIQLYYDNEVIWTERFEYNTIMGGAWFFWKVNNSIAEIVSKGKEVYLSKGKETYLF